MSDTATAEAAQEAPEPQDAEAQTDQQPETGEQEKDWKAEAEKWQALSQKMEKRAKENAKAAKELETVRRESMTEQERAVEEAREAARTEVFREVGTQRVDDAVRLAASGRNLDVDALLDGLDRSRFLTDEFAPDTEAIQSWVDRIVPKPDDGIPDLGQGARGSSLPLNGDGIEKALKAKLGIR